jgi:hypothetical protein
MRSKNGSVRIRAESSCKLKNEIHCRDECVNITIAEHVDTETIHLDISLGIRTQILKLDLMRT